MRFVPIVSSAVLLAACTLISSNASAADTAQIKYTIAGAVTADSARFNVQTVAGGLVEAQLVAGDAIHTASAVTTEEAPHALLVFDGLEADTRYDLLIDGEVRGGTRTFPTADDPRPLRFAYGSCMNSYSETVRVTIDGQQVQIPNHGIWEHLAEEEVDALFIIGDRIYPPNPYEFYEEMTDEEGRAFYAEYHAHMMTIPHLADILSRTPTYVIWDDHDFGPNDSAKNYHLAHVALEAVEETFANPPMGEPGNPGCYFATNFGPNVDAFFLDGRMHRDCANRTTNRGGLLCRPAAERQADGTYIAVPTLDNCFGPRQMAWLKHGLMNSDADVKLIIAGGQFLSDIHRFEAWYHFHEREEFFDWLAESNIPGVVFLSGDRHHGEIGRLANRGAYPWYEMTSSGLAVNTYGADDDTPESPYEVLGPVASVHHYGIVDIDPEGRSISLSLVTGDGVVNERRIAWDEIQP